MYSLLVTYRFNKREDRDGFYEAVCEDKIAKCVMVEDGCIRYEYEVPAEDTILLLHEDWKDKDAQQAHTHLAPFSRVKGFKVRFKATTELEELSADDAAGRSFMDLAKARYSVRSFKDTPVEDEKIEKILEAARIAPTAKNAQPQKIFVLKSAESVATINEHCRCIYGAPLVFAIGYEESRVFGISEERVYGFGEIDSSIVTTHMMLEAADLGLGSCWVGLFNDKEVRTALNIPDGIRITALLPVGYASDDCVPADRHEIFRPDEEMVEFI